MEQERKQQEPVVRADGETFSLDESQTGRFGITKAEFKKLIVTILRETRSGSRPQRTLFRLLLRRMSISTRSKHEQEYLKEYLIHLRQMKEDGIVEFVSGKTKVNVKLLK